MRKQYSSLLPLQIHPALVNAHTACRFGLAAVLAAGVLLGLAASKAISAYVAREFDPDRTSLENAELRQKVS
jgi:hypothetical protein